MELYSFIGVGLGRELSVLEIFKDMARLAAVLLAPGAASECTGECSQGLRDFYLKVEASIWP